NEPVRREHRVLALMLLPAAVFACHRAMESNCATRSMPAALNSAWTGCLASSGVFMAADNVAVDPLGGVWVGGMFDGTVLLGNTNRNLDLGRGPIVATFDGDQFVARFDSLGVLQWVKAHLGDAVVLDHAGNAIVTEDLDAKFNLVKLSPEGDEISRTEIAS